MKSQKMNREQLSSLMDGETNDADAQSLLSHIQDSHLVDDWALYQRIGDSLRENAKDTPLSSGFMAKLQSRLDLEPVIVAPRRSGIWHGVRWWQRLVSRKLALWAALAASLATLVFNVAVLETNVAAVDAPVNLAQDNQVVLSASNDVIAAEVAPLADAPIEDYMRAHHNLTPALYSPPKYTNTKSYP